MTKRIAALYCVYNDDVWLRYSVRSIYDHVERIYFLVNDRPWAGSELDGGTTVRSIAALPDPEGKLNLIQQSWPDEIAQRNFSLALAQVDGFEYALVVDADEIYDGPELSAMIEYAIARPEIDCWHSQLHTYWKSLRYVIDPPENHHPAMLIKLGEVAFVETRNPLGTKHELIPPSIGMCHHMSYARTDELIRRKTASFSHAHQMQSGWFENIWKKWDAARDMQNLHPTIPTQYARAREQKPSALPSVLRELAARSPNFPQEGHE